MKPLQQKKQDKKYYREIHNLQLTSTEDNEKMYDYLEELEAKTVFEFGCNAGRHLIKLNERGFQTFGIDLSKRAIKHAKEQLLNVKCADEKFLPTMKDDSFDAVITVSVLNHIYDIDEIVQHLKRISKKHIVICENNTKTNDGTVAPWHAHNYEKHGFKKVREYISKNDNLTPYTMYLWSK